MRGVLLAAALAAFTIPALSGAACGGDDIKKIRGAVVGVQPASLTEVQSLVVRDDDGVLWAFRTEGPIGFTPSHLKEHQVFGQPVTVLYRETDEGLLAIEVTD